MNLQILVARDIRLNKADRAKCTITTVNILSSTLIECMEANGVNTKSAVECYIKTNGYYTFIYPFGYDIRFDVPR